MNTRIGFRCITAALLLVTLVGGALWGQTPSGTLKYGELADPVTLEPYLNDDAVSKRLTALIYGSLVRMNRDLEIEPDLAVSWRRETDDQRRTVYILQLRDNVFWHDGIPFTSLDVVATWETVTNPETRTTEKSRFLGIDQVVAIDERTVRITFDENYSAGIGNLTFPILPAHLLQDRVLDVTDQIVYDPVGTGPFRFERWVEGRFVMLRANRRYYEPELPRLERIVMQVFTNDSTMFQSLESGDIHLLFDIPPEEIPRFQNNRDVRVLNEFGHSYEFVGLNLNRPPLDQRLVRRAITLSINRRELVDNLYQGRARIISGPFPVTSWAYNPAVPPLPFDPSEARRLLDEASIVDTNGDGIREYEGRPVRLTALALRGDELVLNRSLAVQQYLRNVGIEVETEFVPLVLFMQRVFQDHDFDLFTTGWSIGIDPDPYSIWFSGEIADGLNAIGYYSEEVDSLILQARQTPDKERRRLLYHRVHELISADAPYVFLWTEERNVGVRANFSNFQLDVFNLTRALVTTELDGE